MSTTTHPIFLMTVLLLWCSATLAETVYVRDTLYVPLRGGQTTEHRILHRGLKSGTPLELLETNEETGFSRVQTQSNVVGWIKTQYLTEQPIASDALVNLKQEHSALEAQYQQTLLRQQSLNTENADLARALDDAVEKNKTIERELNEITALAADVITINEENKRLEVLRDSLNTEIEDLMQVIRKLNDRENQNWFLIGAGVVFGGLLIGFWVARRLYNRRGSSGWA